MKTWTTLLSCTVLMCAGAHAQTVYRIVGADGKVTFSDQPPAASQPVKVTNVNTGAGAGIASASLPFELRQAASKYPVTLYSTNECGACDAARTLLTTRGIPFTEKTVTTAEDGVALKKIAGVDSLPFATIGSQHIKGLNPSEWNQYLDAAGYPKTSILSASYKNPAPSPLVAVKKAELPAPRPTEPTPTSRPSAPAFNPNNPAGIQF